MIVLDVVGGFATRALMSSTMRMTGYSDSGALGNGVVDPYFVKCERRLEVGRDRVRSFL